ncbi:hypothetical protein BLA60_25950 [Actinophytocola xinjiangensis]|uniref:Uncharacterized protein n=1 Tax=Actinophytocola xinjiangensis TaxID=485602 RepID=A0A7Z0WI71_9PSEU|nr:hypothetical protein [Actinophytocola xinjiangensis]OLF07771.1 hypothetical protein BLA60_25950 [Actinophytocola xinjiangensis]
MDRTRWIAWGGALLAALGAGALWLPWWRAPAVTLRYQDGALTEEGRQTLRGTEVVGGGVVWLLVLTAFVVVVAVANDSRRESPTTWWWLAGAGAVGSGVAVATVWSWGFAVGSAVTLGAGLVLFGGALTLLVGTLDGRRRVLAAATALLAVPVWFVTVEDPGYQRPDAAPLDLVLAAADRRSTEPPRGGASLLPATEGHYGLVPAPGGPAVSLPEGIVTVEDDRVVVLVRNHDSQVSLEGVVEGRLVVRGPDREVRVVAPGEKAATVSGALSAGPLSAAGTMLVTTGDRGDPVLRRLDVTDGLTPGEDVAADSLPEVAAPSMVALIGNAPGGSFPVREHPGSRRLVASDHLPGARLVSTGQGDGDWAPLAGGYDETCWLNNRAVESYLVDVDSVAPAGADGWWLATSPGGDSRLLTVTGDGVLRAAPAVRVVGAFSGLAEAADGSLLAVSRTGLWRLPADAVQELPDPPADCAAHPEVGEPARLVPLAARYDTTAALPLDVHGRRAEVTGDGTVVAVAPSGARTTLGRRIDDPRIDEQDRREIVPDGSGGVWWLETVPPNTPVTDETGGTNPLQTRRLVHATAGGEVRRFGRVPGGDDIDLALDLSGGQPLVGTCVPVRFAGGAERPVPALAEFTQCLRVAVGPDGRGWAVSNKGLFVFDPDSAGKARAVIDPRGTDQVPVAVQLAHGTAPSALTLDQTTVAFDVAGRPLVLDDDVLLGLSAAGDPVVVAQDERLRGARLFGVEGGALVRAADGTLFRLDH